MSVHGLTSKGGNRRNCFHSICFLFTGYIFIIVSCTSRIFLLFFYSGCCTLACLQSAGIFEIQTEAICVPLYCCWIAAINIIPTCVSFAVEYWIRLFNGGLRYYYVETIQSYQHWKMSRKGSKIHLKNVTKKMAGDGNVFFFVVYFLIFVFTFLVFL